MLFLFLSPEKKMKIDYLPRVLFSVSLLVLCVGLSGCANCGLRGQFGKRAAIEQELLASGGAGGLERYRAEVNEVAAGSSTRTPQVSEHLPSYPVTRSASAKSCGST